jgi:uncharacterized protein with HEPN domain
MRHYAQLASSFAKTWDLELDEEDSVTFLAISYCLGIIGGAACQVSADAIPVVARTQWPRVTALRDRMIKEYRTVTPDFVFGVVHEDLPPLMTALGFTAEASLQ